MSNLQEILEYINSLNGSSKHENCDCGGECFSTCKTDNHKTEENSSDYEKEFEGCGEDCLGANCDCCRDPKDKDEDEDLVETAADIDKKTCSACGKEHHIRNFISLMNGTETRTCLPCREQRNSKIRPTEVFYQSLKASMEACIKCGDNDPDHLEFNHIVPETKNGEVGKMGTIAKQKEERKGCNSMCKKCHIVHTYTFQRPEPMARPDSDRVQRARNFVNNYKISLCGCQNPNCKDKFDKNVLAFYEFHHKDYRTKLYKISAMVGAGYSIKAIKKELEKCILLCSYCHKKETIAEWGKRKEYYTSLDRPLTKRKKQETKLTLDDAKEIRRLYNEENLTQENIAARFNVHRAHIGKVVNNKCHIDQSYTKPNLKMKYKGTLTEEYANEIRDLYNNENTSFYELAKNYKISNRYVRDVVANKAHYNEKYVRTRFPVELTNEHVAEIRDLYNNKNKAFSEIAMIFDITDAYVGQIVANICRIDEKYVRTRLHFKLTDKDVKDIRKLYNEKNVSIVQLAKDYEMSRRQMSDIIGNKSYCDDDYVRTRTHFKLTSEDVKNIRKLYNDENVSIAQLAEDYEMSKRQISDIIGNTAHYDANYVRTRLPSNNFTIENNLDADNHEEKSPLESKREVKDKTEKRLSKLSDDDVVDIRELYNNENVSISQLSKDYEIGERYISDIISNTKRVNEKYTRTRFPVQLSDTDVDDIRYLYNYENVPFSELAKDYEVSETHIADIIGNRAYRDEKYIRTRFPTKLTDEDIKEVRRLYNEENVTFTQLAKDYKVSEGHVADIVGNRSHYDEKYGRTRFTTKLIDEDAKEMRRLYNDENVTFTQLAKDYEVSEGHVTDIIGNRAHYDEKYVKTRFSTGLTVGDIADIRHLYNDENIPFIQLAKDYKVSEGHVADIVGNRAHYDEKYVRTRFATKLTDEDAKEIRRLYNDENVSADVLANTYEIGLNYIGAIIANRERVDNEYVRTRFSNKLRDEDVKEMRRLYNEENVQCDKLAETYDITVRYAKEIISNKQRIDDNYIITNFSDTKKLTDEYVAEIRDLYNNENTSFSELAENYDICVDYVRGIIANTQRIDNNYVRTNFSSGVRGKLTNENVAELRHVYNTTNISFSDLAKKYDISPEYARKIVANTERTDKNYVRTRATFPIPVAKDTNVIKIIDTPALKLIVKKEVVEKEVVEKEVEKEVVKKEVVKKITRRKIEISMDVVKEIRLRYNNFMWSYKYLSEQYKISIPVLRSLILNEIYVDATYRLTRIG